MNEDLLEATSALTLSPRKDRAARVIASRFFPANCNKEVSPPLTNSHRQNQDSLHCSLHDLAHTTKRSFSDLTCNQTAEEDLQSMPKGSKRLKIESKATRSDTLASPSSKSLTRPRQNEDSGSTAYAPIVISDDDDEEAEEYGNGTEAANGVDQEEGPAPADESPDSSAPLQSLASRFTYESPTKARTIRNGAPTSIRLGSLKRAADLEQHSSASASSSIISKSSATEESFTSAPTSTDSVSKRAPKKSKAGKAIKTIKDLTIKPKKTFDQAKEAGVEPLDLGKISAQGFRLITRCSFCAGSFTKSATPKVKQEHMSLCGPLSGITQSEAAIDAVVSDIRNAFNRDEKAKRKARDDRTLFQEVVQDADIVLHEGRASQIQASPKKRGKDSVITKKAIKRSTKAPLLISEVHSSNEAFSAQPAGNNLISAQKARLLARDLADQLFGRVTSSTTTESVSPNQAEDDEQGHVDAHATAQPETVIPHTPRRDRPRTLTSNPGGSLVDGDDTMGETTQLPVVSAEQVFASMSASVSPHKSPIKALQKSRERQASRDNDLLFESEGSELGLGSPSLPRTQQFAPSKLAQRLQAPKKNDVPSLFAAQTTTRSLLDLVNTHRKSESREVSAELKRKSAEAEEEEHSPHPKRCKTVANVDEAELKPSGLNTDSTRLSSRRLSHEGIGSGNPQVPHAEHASTFRSDCDMDVDADTVEAILSQPHESNRSTSAKLREQNLNAAKILSASLAQVTHKPEASASPSSQQAPTAVIKDTDRPSQALNSGDVDDCIAEGFDTDSILEDDDEDAQSFLELLEPLEVPPNHIPSPTYSLSEPSSEDLDEPDSRDSAYRIRRMTAATGGGSFSIESRRKPIRAEVPPASQAYAFVRNVDTGASHSPISNSDPEANPSFAENGS